MAGLGLLTCQRGDQYLPAIRIVDPADNSVVPAILKVHALAVSYYGIVSTNLYVDDSLITSAYVSQDNDFLFVWNASNEPAGSKHKLQANVQDADGNTAVSNVVEITIAGASGPTVHQGIITSDQTWYAAGSPHVVSGVLDVEAQLTIQPGAIIAFDTGARLRIGRQLPGALVAQGESSLITFTSNDSNPNPGDWAGIEFGPLAEIGKCVLDNCLIEYGGRETANVVSESGQVRMTNCIIRRSANYGVYAGPLGLLSFNGNIATENGYSGLGITAMGVATIGTGNRLSGNGFDVIEIVDGLIALSTRWPAFDVPYEIDQDLVITDGDWVPTQLTIEPGVEVMIGGEASIITEQFGMIVADGAGGPIRFSGDDGGSGIVINSLRNCPPSVFHNCTFDNLGGLAALQVEGGQVDICNTTITNQGGYGITLSANGSFAAFNDNTITGCAWEALVIDAQYVPTIGTGNRLTGNNGGNDVIYVNCANEVSASGTWPNCGVPYQVLDDIVIEEQSEGVPVVTLAPGVTLELEGAGIYVGTADGPGGLVADGTNGRITFSGSPSGPTSGGWYSIIFSNNNGGVQSVLRNCLIEGGGHTMGNIVCDSLAPIIEGNEISHSATYGLMLFGDSLNSDTLRVHNWFHDNALGDIGMGAFMATRPRYRHTQVPRVVSRPPRFNPPITPITQIRGRSVSVKSAESATGKVRGQSTITEPTGLSNRKEER
jgi:hypothetical protein